MPPCSQITVRGTPCKFQAVEGSDRCTFHLRLHGNSSLFTDELTDRLLTLLRAGNYHEVAARAAGIAPRTLREWLQRGRSARVEDEPYREFAEKVEQAKAQGEAVHVARIARAADEDWHAAAWFLERAFPDRWGRVSMRLREPPEPPPQPMPVDEDDPFEEVDELARKRRKHTLTT